MCNEKNARFVQNTNLLYYSSRHISKAQIRIRHGAAVYFPQAYAKAIDVAFPIVRLTIKNLRSCDSMLISLNIMKRAIKSKKDTIFRLQKSITLSRINTPLAPCNREFRCFQSYPLDSELRLEQHQNLRFSEFHKHRSACSRS